MRQAVVAAQAQNYWRVDADRAALSDPLLGRAGGVVPNGPAPTAPDQMAGWLPKGPLPKGPPPAANPSMTSHWPRQHSHTPVPLSGIARQSIVGTHLDPSFRAWRPGAVAAAVASAAVRGPPSVRVWAAAHLCAFGVGCFLAACLSVWQLVEWSGDNVRGDGCHELRVYLLISGVAGLALLPFGMVFAVLSVREVWEGPYAPRKMLEDFWRDRPWPAVPALTALGALFQLVLALTGSVFAWTSGKCSGASYVRTQLVCSYSLAFVVSVSVPIGAYITLGPQRAGKAAERARQTGAGGVPLTRRRSDGSERGFSRPSSPRFAASPRFVGGSSPAPGEDGPAPAEDPQDTLPKATRKAVAALAAGASPRAADP
eukprot:TRINITY_DN12902_c0_g1_i1.p1 TRINITY_DN12902_c0_g1~~TRINITY_DN12902_c0_g1_i1.p1  ORF type:complete len:405 (+),score=113.50 TRINITY_DN12902_c0_g1_i1:103-1215(+)